MEKKNPYSKVQKKSNVNEDLKKPVLKNNEAIQKKQVVSKRNNIQSKSVRGPEAKSREKKNASIKFVDNERIKDEVIRNENTIKEKVPSSKKAASDSKVSVHKNIKMDRPKRIESKTSHETKKEAAVAEPDIEILDEKNSGEEENISLIRGVIHLVLPFVLTFAITAIIALAVMTTWHPAIVNGSSMNPTLSNGDILICSADFDEEDISRGDIVIFKTDARNVLIKRVIALPGETIAIKDGVVYINGERLVENFDLIEDAGVLTNESIKLKEHMYFCMGDNRNNSIDCRLLGPISYDQINLKVKRSLMHKEIGK